MVLVSELIEEKQTARSRNYYNFVCSQETRTALTLPALATGITPLRSPPALEA